VTRRPVLPGAAELFRRTDAAAPQPAPVTELPNLAATQSSPALRSSTSATRRTSAADQPEAVDQAAGQPLSLVPAAPGGGQPDELSALRGLLPVAAPRRRGQSENGRAKHDEKITVYCSAEELLALETARLTLRGQHGVVADRGRIVREAVAVLLADLEQHGDDSILVQRLR
jgi:hypothetical protein